MPRAKYLKNFFLFFLIGLDTSNLIAMARTNKWFIYKKFQLLKLVCLETQV